MAETLQRWMNRCTHAKKYTIFSILISNGAYLFGADTGSIGPITTMPQFTAFFGQLTPIVHGLVVSSILIPAALASFFAGGISDKLGRPRTVGLGLVIFGIGAALQAAAQNLAMLFVARIITGLGEGIFMSPITVYVCEIAPPAQRGMLCSIQQFLLSFGICAGYFICYGTVRADDNDSIAWRIPFATQSFLAFSFSVAAFGLPHSPRWLEIQGRHAEAEIIWDRLGIPSAQQEKNSQQAPAMDHSLTEALAASPAPPTQPVESKAHPLAMFKREVLSRTLLGAALMTFQQLSGIDGVLYYAPLLFESAGLTSSTSSFLASGVSALLMLLITFPAFIYADRWGRRTSILTGGVIITFSMLLVGILYAAQVVHGDYGAGRWVVVVLIYVFALGFEATWAITVRVYASEIQPLRTRAPATSLAQSMNWITNYVVALITPLLLSKAVYSIYFLFGGCTAIALIIFTYAMPETTGKSLEDIDKEFERRRAKRALNVGLVSKLIGGKETQVIEIELGSHVS